MEINGVDDKMSVGKITIDSGAAENVPLRSYLPEVPVQPSPGSQRGISFHRSPWDQGGELGTQAHRLRDQGWREEQCCVSGYGLEENHWLPCPRL